MVNYVENICKRSSLISQCLILFWCNGSKPEWEDFTLMISWLRDDQPLVVPAWPSKMALTAQMGVGVVFCVCLFVFHRITHSGIYKVLFKLDKKSLRSTLVFILVWFWFYICWTLKQFSYVEANERLQISTFSFKLLPRCDWSESLGTVETLSSYRSLGGLGKRTFMF